MRVTLVFEDVDSSMAMAEYPKGTVKLSIIPDHAPGLSEEELRSSPAAMWAKTLTEWYELAVPLLGGKIKEPGNN